MAIKPTSPIQGINEAVYLASEAARTTDKMEDYLEDVRKFIDAFTGCVDIAEEGADVVTIPLKKWQDALRDFRAVV